MIQEWKVLSFTECLTSNNKSVSENSKRSVSENSKKFLNLLEDLLPGVLLPRRNPILMNLSLQSNSLDRRENHEPKTKTLRDKRISNVRTRRHKILKKDNQLKCMNTGGMNKTVLKMDLQAKKNKLRTIRGEPTTLGVKNKKKHQK